jgi:hypothetical protein|tara:strand:+ start:77 stop:631 length:555 start_codon:yes stop_codon:yes gene_type:complete
MATTFVEIANRALTFLGAEPITTLSDDTKEARTCNRLFEQTRDQLLRDHPWNFAIKRVALAANTIAPIFEYTNAFNFPDSTLRIIEVDTTEEWAVEGRTIVTDASAPLNIVYIERVTDPNLFDTKFIETFALRLAADIAYDITASQTVAQTAEQKFTQSLQATRLVDAQESLSADEQTWLDARN